MIWHDSQALSTWASSPATDGTCGAGHSRATLLSTQAIDLERTLRRYAVLGDDAHPGQLSAAAGKATRELLATHQDSIPDAGVYGRSRGDAGLARWPAGSAQGQQEATSPCFTGSTN